MKRYLYIVRHARAEDGSSFFGDFQRELTSSGIIDAARMGRFLAEKGVKPDLILSSSAPRALKTAQIMAEQLGYDPAQITDTRNLYDGGSRAYLQAVTSTPDTCQTLMIFGHNPDVSFFSEYVTHADIGNMSKAGVVAIEIENLDWSMVSMRTGKFLSYDSPKQLREDL
ncbi:MAG: histidine phosphatase family protein [Spirosomaceae bacterium]|jgi:phosphohistidine phosphatase|nr:histidine phosphatase family protein [Spirosomataceae bacterium]